MPHPTLSHRLRGVAMAATFVAVAAHPAAADDTAPPAAAANAGREIAALQALVAQGSARAEFELARRLEFGIGIGKDETRAAILFCAAATQGDARAADRLGRLYLAGTGVPRDPGRAGAWLRRADAAGSAEARTVLATLPAGAGAGQTATCGTPVPVRGPPIPLIAPREIRARVEKMAPGYGLDPNLVLAMIQTESGFDITAVSPRNARGLMQLIPETATEYGVSNPFDVDQNLNGGMKYLRWLLAYYQGDLPLVLAAYNAGAGAVDKAGGIPDFDETRDYVDRIRRIYGHDTHPFKTGLTAPSAILGARQVAEVE